MRLRLVPVLAAALVDLYRVASSQAVLTDALVAPLRTAPRDFSIPFFVRGRGVGTGADLYALNPGRANPGTPRPTYGAAVQPVRNAEAADLVTDLLGLRAVPGSRVNATQTLDVG